MSQWCNDWKELCKRAWRTCKVVVLLIKTCYFLPFSLSSLSSLVLFSSSNSATMVTWRHTSPLYWKNLEKQWTNRPFYRYGGHIEFLIFKEYYGLPKGHSLSINAHFSGKKTTSLYISLEKGNLITSKHGTTIFFSHCNLFLGKLKEKIAPKARVHTERV